MFLKRLAHACVLKPLCMEIFLKNHRLLSAWSLEAHGSTWRMDVHDSSTNLERSTRWEARTRPRDFCRYRSKYLIGHIIRDEYKKGHRFVRIFSVWNFKIELHVHTLQVARFWPGHSEKCFRPHLCMSTVQLQSKQLGDSYWNRIITQECLHVEHPVGCYRRSVENSMEKRDTWITRGYAYTPTPHQLRWRLIELEGPLRVQDVSIGLRGQ